MTTAAPALNPAPTPLVSASQVSLWRECQRKWAWKYIARVDVPYTDANKLGDDVDSGQLQPYLQDGRPFDFTRPSGNIAVSGLAYLPQPKHPGLEVQKHFLMPSPTGLPSGLVPGGNPGARRTAKFGYQGFLDLWLPNGGLPNRPDQIVTVGDFKTTKDLKWQKTEDELAVDVQSMLYATWAMLVTGARTIDLSWIYFRTDPKQSPKADATTIRVDVAHVGKQFEAIDATANEMFDARKAAPGGGAEGEASEGVLAEHVRSLPVSVDMCLQFGGCPHRHRCNLSPSQEVEALAALERSRARGRPSRRLPILASNEEPKKEHVPMSTASVLANLRARRAGATAAPTAPVAPPPPAPAAPTAPAGVMGCADTAVPPAPVDRVPAPLNPPESALPPAAPIGSVAAPPPAPPPAPAEAPKRRGPGRPRAAAPAPAPSAPPAGSVGDDGAGEPETAEQAFNSKRIGTVYFDSCPINGEYVTAESLFSIVSEVIAETHKVPDYRLIDFKGAGIFAITLAEVVDSQAWGDVICDTRTPEGAIAKSVFASRARRVVQGMR